MKAGPALSVVAALATLAVVFGPRWHHPMASTQLGPDGLAMLQFASAEPQVAAMNRPPGTGSFGVEAAAMTDSRAATEVYRGLQVLKDGTAGAFMTSHVAMTNWVAAKEGCAFCHAGADYAAEGKPQKAVARTMIGMVRTINTEWAGHVGQPGVTCFTCHRGQAVPSALWYPREAAQPKPMMARQDDWHETATTVRDFFPDNAFAEFFLQGTRGKGLSYTALPSGDVPAPAVTKRLYEVMMQMADGIGVNCTYCHNSRAFHDWTESTPARWAGLDGIHLTQAINRDVLLPLAATIPQVRATQGDGRLPITPAREAGPQNGNGLANCMTCHYGSPKPLPGLDLLAAFPALRRAP